MQKATDHAPHVMQLVTDAGSGVARMTIYGDIAPADWLTVLMGEDGTGTTTAALDVSRALASLSADVTDVEVHINSYGGDVSEGVAIYNALRQSGRRVTTVCDGFACSIASVIFMAGERRVMNPASLLMLHEPSLPATSGTAEQLRKQAADLDVIAQLSKTAYLAPGGIEPDELDEVMRAETWVSPEQAVEWGLATEVADEPEGGTPTQSARQAVALALAHGPARERVVAEFRLDAGEVARRVIDLMDERARQGDVPEPSAEPEPGLPRGGYALYSAIANQE